jgi:hypothetical protein
MDSMEKENKKYVLRKREEEKRPIEGEIILRAAREGRDLLDYALESVEEKIIYPSPIEWQQLTRRISQHVCAPHAAIEALTSGAKEGVMAAPSESEWAALSRAVRQRVLARERRRHALGSFIESLRTIFTQFSADRAAFVLVLVVGIVVFAVMTYVDVTFFAAQASANLFQPVKARTAYINDVISGKIVVATAPFYQRYYLYEEGRG